MRAPPDSAAPLDSAASVRDGEELPIPALSAYLENLFGESAVLEVSQFRGGHSNLTYLLRFGEREMILRRPPIGSKVATAHDMGREFRVLSALSAHYSKAPSPIAMCEDLDVVGAPFYLMERVRGIILRRKPPDDLDLGADSCDLLCAELVGTLAELHAIDFADIGLGELGRPAGYVERQVTGWTKRFEKSKTEQVDEADEVALWLATNRPSSARAALIHNDFKFDNIVLDAATLKAIGILDWEMATVGDPLMDLGASLAYWVESTDAKPLIELAFAPTYLPGMWTRKQLIESYQQLTNQDVDRPVFFYVFGLFKLAVIVQQIYFRYAKGLTRDKRFASLGATARVLLTQAASAIDRGSI